MEDHGGIPGFVPAIQYLPVSTFFEEVAHETNSVKLMEPCVFLSPAAALSFIQNNNVPDSKLRAPFSYKFELSDIGFFISQDKIRDAFLLYHHVPSLVIENIQLMNKGYGCSGHVQSVKGIYGLQVSGGQKACPGAIFIQDSQAGKNSGIVLPL